jgi:predicted DNA-binding transcriptional regulator AlpA
MYEPSTAGRLLTKPQLADLLQVSQRTVDRWYAEDRLPDGLRVEISGTVRFRQDIATQWVAAGCPRACDDLQDARTVDP